MDLSTVVRLAEFWAIKSAMVLPSRVFLLAVSALLTLPLA
ncbi:hypothetical protein PS655_05795 [Pseudomonas fluorescens]|uniref:Uncharacterized protein n=1 Tax=Pseudomonas fluorescens TaxID=294 RepID=A0A5E6XWX9_PSEFL|nr:hypothetical protein PS655_05795 [Pseudomonas fluorescens]